MTEIEKPDGKRAGIRQITGTRWIVFVILFGVTGFLGLPLLWLSPVFSKPEKVVWSVVVVIYTCLLIAITLWICYWALSRIAGVL